VDPRGLVDNPFPRLPSFTDAFDYLHLFQPYVGPTLDIIVGSLEVGGGMAVVAAQAGAVLVGPEVWWVPILIWVGWC
jgi:hypothetical protein